MKILHACIIFLLVCIVFALQAQAGDKVYTIEDAYKAALVSNEIVKIAEEDVAQSGYRVDQAWTYLYPRLVAQGAYTRFTDAIQAGGFTLQPFDQYQASLVLTQPLYTGGRTLAALRTAKKTKETSDGSLSLAKQDMMLSVAEAYYGVLKAQKSVDISKRSFERMTHHKEITEREAATRRTKANQSALLRANSLVSQAWIALVRAQDGIRIARDKLSQLTKLPIGMQISEPAQLTQPSGSLEDLQKTALDNRDDYKSAAVNRSIAEENVTIVTGGHYPQLSAVAGAQYQDSRPVVFTDATSYYAGLRLTVPIFEGGLMKAEVSEAKSKVRQADFSRDRLRIAIGSDVLEAYVNLQTVTSVLDTAKQELEYAKGSYEAVEGLFSEGLLESLALIDAEQALTLAEQELMNDGYDRELAILRLRKSIGLLGKES